MLQRENNTKQNVPEKSDGRFGRRETAIETAAAATIWMCFCSRQAGAEPIQLEVLDAEGGMYCFINPTRSAVSFADNA